MFNHNIIYEDNIIVSLVRRDDPFGISGFFKDSLAEGLRRFEIQMGYMEVVNVEKILMEAGINEKAIFYGLEDIVTKNIFWSVFSIIKKLSPAYVQFYKLPSEKLCGIISRVEM
jgi:KUP system potassium uptake protein